jgi:hypothetical protein
MLARPSEQEFHCSAPTTPGQSARRPRSGAPLGPTGAPGRRQRPARMPPPWAATMGGSCVGGRRAGRLVEARDGPGHRPGGANADILRTMVYQRPLAHGPSIIRSRLKGGVYIYIIPPAGVLRPRGGVNVGSGYRSGRGRMRRRGAPGRALRGCPRMIWAPSRAAHHGDVHVLCGSAPEAGRYRGWPWPPRWAAATPRGSRGATVHAPRPRSGL